MKNVLRWIAVLPAALGAYFVSQILYALGSGMVLNQADWVLQLSQSFIGPMAMVWAGARVAPSAKKAVAVSLVVLYGAVTVSLVVLLAVRGATSGRQLVWLGVCGAIGALAGGMLCAVLDEHGNPPK